MNQFSLNDPKTREPAGNNSLLILKRERRHTPIKQLSYSSTVMPSLTDAFTDCRTYRSACEPWCDRSAEMIELQRLITEWVVISTSIDDATTHTSDQLYLNSGQIKPKLSNRTGTTTAKWENMLQFGWTEKLGVNIPEWDVTLDSAPGKSFPLND